MGNKKDLLKGYVVERLGCIEGFLMDYLKGGEAELLHCLRVDIKKVRAVFNFAEKIYGKAYGLGKLERLFAKAGKIRDIEITIGLLSSFTHPPEKIIKWLRGREEVLVEQFSGDIPVYVGVVVRLRERVSFPDVLPDKKRVSRHFKKRFEKLNILYEKKERGEMHEFRKKLKATMYVCNILPKGYRRGLDLDEAGFNVEQKKLGDWNDVCSAIALLSDKNLGVKGLKEYVLGLKEKEKLLFEGL